MPVLIRIRLGLLALPLAVACHGRSTAVWTPAPPPAERPPAARLGEGPVIRIDTISTRSAFGPPPGGRVRLGYSPMPVGTRLLLVLDGEVIGLLPPMEQPNELRADSSVAGRALAALMPSRIATLSIVRRYQAVEQYGERASGGALMIETKPASGSGAP